MPLSIRFGLVGCDVLRNTSKDWAVVDGIATMAENAGALCDAFLSPMASQARRLGQLFPGSRIADLLAEGDEEAG